MFYSVRWLIFWFKCSNNNNSHASISRCGPCQMMVPVLEKVSEALKDKIQVVKIDTEKYTKIAGDYRIEALPTFILFRDGKPYDRFVSFETPFSVHRK